MLLLIVAVLGVLSTPTKGFADAGFSDTIETPTNTAETPTSTAEAAGTDDGSPFLFGVAIVALLLSASSLFVDRRLQSGPPTPFWEDHGRGRPAP